MDEDTTQTTGAKRQDQDQEFEPGSKLFVGNLSWGTSSESLQAHFEQAGAVVSAFVVRDRETKRSKGFGFVQMATAADAEKAREELNNSELDGREIRVDLAKENN